MCKMFKAVYPIEKRGGVSNSKNCCIVYFLKVIPVTGDRGIVLVLRGEFGLAKKPRSASGCPSVNHILDYISSGEQILFTVVQATPKAQLILYDLFKTYPTKDPNVLWLYHWVDKVLAQRIQDYAKQNGFA